MEASPASPDATERANELYWGSDRSVNQIAEDLDLSKGALYAMIVPEPAGMGCPMCGEEVAYSNRTAKERGRLDCPTCEWDGTAGEARDEPDEEPAFASRPAPLRVASAASDRMRTLAGGALLGAAVGLALVLWARRR